MRDEFGRQLTGWLLGRKTTVIRRDVITRNGRRIPVYRIRDQDTGVGMIFHVGPRGTVGRLEQILEPWRKT